MDKLQPLVKTITNASGLPLDIEPILSFGLKILKQLENLDTPIQGTMD